MLVPMLLVGFGPISIGNFFNSQGDTRASFRVGLVSSAVSIVLSLLLIWILSVFGLLLSIIVTSFIGNVLGHFVLRKKYGLYTDVRHATRLLICSAIPAGVSYGVLQFIPSSAPILGLLIGSFVFLVSCSFLAPFLGALDERDISNLGSMLGASGSSLFSKPLPDVEKRMILFLDSKRKRIFKD